MAEYITEAISVREKEDETILIINHVSSGQEVRWSYGAIYVFDECVRARVCARARARVCVCVCVCVFAVYVSVCVCGGGVAYVRACVYVIEYASLYIYKHSYMYLYYDVGNFVDQAHLNIFTCRVCCSLSVVSLF